MREAAERVGQRPEPVLPGQRQTGGDAGHGAKFFPAIRRRHPALLHVRGGGRGAGGGQRGLRAPLPERSGDRRDLLRCPPDRREDPEGRAGLTIGWAATLLGGLNPDPAESSPPWAT